MKKNILLAAVGLLAIAGAEQQAEAERRQNSLSGDVAVRHRRLLVKNRFELAPLFESTINADFRHIVGGGAKLEYHLGDMLSIGVIGVGSTAIDTGLVKKILPTLERDTNNATREPSVAEFNAHLNSMPFHGAAYVSLTPWYGKLAAFSQAYVAFDFYFQAGVSYAILTSDCPTTICSDPAPGMSSGPGGMNPPDNNPNNDAPLNDGSRLGLYLGGGIHVFLSDFIALDLTVRDYAFSDNPSGADFNANLAVTSDDSRFLHHIFFGVGISIMFPTTVKRTN
ncbi:MAG: outer membrane beta-barrel domain-containing protein [Deltaproteobacteria bacterium]|nr:outer membrane beta-barrel domain-containing protein [Deltaproteobacteria bacterium]